MRPNIKDLTGKKFGRLTAVRIHSHAPIRWECNCECGAKHVTLSASLVNGRSRSCGCLSRDVAIATHSTHGRHKTKEYKTFLRAKARCQNRNYPSYEYYGGRGIEFKFESFDQFLSEVGSCPSPALTLDRIDPEKHYEPGNVRWASWTEQANNRRNNVR